MRDASVPYRYILGVDYIYRSRHLRVSVKTRGRIDLKRCTHDQQDICSFNSINGSFYLRDSLAEPYDMRPELASGAISPTCTASAPMSKTVSSE